MAGRIRSTLDPRDNLFLARVERGDNKVRPAKKRRLGPGRKTFEWEAARRVLKIRFQEAGITSCEATFPHECWRTSGLGFAHSKKRRDVVGDELYEVALLCPVAHSILELLPKEQMRIAVLKIIKNRPVPLS